MAASLRVEIDKSESGRLVLSIAEVAARLGVSDDLVYELVHQRRLPCLRLGRRLVVPVRAVNAVIDECLAGFDPSEAVTALRAHQRRDGYGRRKGTTVADTASESSAG